MTRQQLQPGGQKVIASVSGSVVDTLEVVELEMEEAVQTACRPVSKNCERYTLGEELAVGKSGDGVVEGLVGQILLVLVSFADVGERDDDTGNGQVTQSVGQL